MQLKKKYFKMCHLQETVCTSCLLRWCGHVHCRNSAHAMFRCKRFIFFLAHWNSEGCSGIYAYMGPPALPCACMERLK